MLSGQLLDLPNPALDRSGENFFTMDIFEITDAMPTLNDRIKRTVKSINEKLSTVVFCDDKEDYTLPLVTEEEFRDVCKRSKEQWLKSSLAVITIDELIDLPCTLIDQSSIKLLNKDGKVVVREVPKVLPKTLHALLKQYGRNGAVCHWKGILEQLFSIPKIGKQNPGE